MRGHAYDVLMQVVLNAISDPTRRAALTLLQSCDELCACELMARLNASQSRMSRHMKIFQDAGLVIGRRDANWVRYHRNPGLAPKIAAVIDAVLAAERILEEDIA